MRKGCIASTIIICLSVFIVSAAFTAPVGATLNGSLMATFVDLISPKPATEPVVKDEERPDATNGKIVFQRGQNAGSSIFLITPATPPAQGAIQELRRGYHPSFSPDGSKIVFVDNTAGATNGQIMIMNADGSNVQPLRAGGVSGSRPVWNPTGTKLLFERRLNPTFPFNTEIFVIDVAGTAAETNITNNTAEDEYPAWGAATAAYPDGRVAFQSTRSASGAGYDIFVMFPHAGQALESAPLANASNATSNQATTRDTHPRWSPDGSKLAITSDRDDPGGEIYSMIIDSPDPNVPQFGQLARLTNGPNSDEAPAWSPDGTKIVFSRHTGNNGSNYELFTVNPTPGSTLENITNSLDHDERNPSWGAAGATPTGVDLAIVDMIDIPDPVAKGSNYNYRFILVNRSTTTATGVKIVFDPIPQQIRVHPIMTNCNMAQDRTVTCTFGDIAGGGSSTVNVTFAADEVEEVEVRATVSANEPDPNTADNSQEQDTTILPPADVGIVLSPRPPTSVQLGDTVTIAATMTNHGPETARGVKFDGFLDSGFSDLTVINGIGCTVSGTHVSCALGNITSGAIARVTFTGKATQGGTAPVRVFESVDETKTVDPNPNNSGDTANIVVVVPSADLGIFAQYSPNINTVRVGDEYTYYFTVSNNGPAPATGTGIFFVIGGGVSPVVSKTDERCSSDVAPTGEVGYLCNLGTIPNGSSVDQVGITVKALKAGVRADTARVAANEPDNQPNNDTVDVRVVIGGGQADLGISADFPTKAGVEDQVAITINVSNFGPSAAENAVLRIQKFSGTGFVSISLAGCTESGGVHSCPLGTLAPAQTITATYTVQPHSIGDMPIEISARSDTSEPSPDPHLNGGTVKVKIVPKVAVTGIEVTQGLQTVTNSFTLVAGRATFARVHVKAPTDDLNNSVISGKLTVRKVSTGEILGSASPANQGQQIKMIKDPQRILLNDSLYFQLPTYWLKEGDIEFEFGGDDSYICQESDGSPDCKVKIKFNANRSFSIRLFQTTFIDTDGNTITTSLEDLNQALVEIRANFPIADVSSFALDSWTVKKSYCTNKNLSALLNDLKTIRAKDCEKSLSKTGQCKAGVEDIYMAILPSPSQLFCASTASGMADTPLDRYAIRRDNTSNNTVAMTGFANSRAHELGHLFGMSHTCYQKDDKGNFIEGGCGPGAPPDGTISAIKDLTDPDAFFGFDAYRSILTETGSGYTGHGRIYGPSSPDMMSYGPAAWPSASNYAIAENVLLGGLTKSDEAKPTIVAANELFFLSGTVSFDDETVQLDSVETLDADGEVVLPPAGDFSVRFETASGAPIATYSFAVTPFSEGDIGGFALMLPGNPTARRIVFLRGNKVIGEKQASANMPTITVTSPNGGETLSAATANISWTANDGDNDQLKYSVEYSTDGGQNWDALISNLTETSYQIDVSKIPSSSQGLMRVTASDGFNSATDVSNAVFAVPQHAPVAFISSPKSATMLVGDQTLILSGTSFDVDEGMLPESKISWSSSRNGPIGTGRSVDVNAMTLQEGTHTITMTAEDSTGRTGTATASVQVFRERPVIPAALSLGPSALSFTFSGSMAPTQKLAIRNSGDGDLTWSATTDKPWIMLSSTTGTAPSNVDVGIGSLTGMPVGTYTAKITVTSSAVGSPQIIDVNLNILKIAAPAPVPGFDGDIDRADPGAAGNGNGTVDVVDIFWFTQFSLLLHCPGETPYNEFQRVDGNDNGVIDSGDYDYIANVIIGLSPKTAAKGSSIRPAGLCTGVPAVPARRPIGHFDERTRNIRLVAEPTRSGDHVYFNLEVDAQGEERSLTTSLQWDPSVLSIDTTSGLNANPDVVVGPDGFTGQVIGVNALDAVNGRLGLFVDMTGGKSNEGLSAGRKQIVRLRFRVSPDARSKRFGKIGLTDTILPVRMIDTVGRRLEVEWQTHTE